MYILVNCYTYEKKSLEIKELLISTEINADAKNTTTS